MNEKYQPGNIHYYSMIYISNLNSKDVKDSTKIIILIKLKESNGQDFVIKLDEKGNSLLLRKKSSRSTSCTEQSQDALNKNKDLLGKVVIYCDNKVIEEIPNYDKFWEKIKRE